MAVNSLLAGVIAARYLGADAFGAFAVLYAVINTTIQISSFGMPTANTYFVADEKHLAGRAAANSALFAVIAGSFSALCLWLAAIIFPTLFPNTSSGLVALAAFALPFQLATLLVVSFFISLGNVNRSNTLDLIGQSLVLLSAFVTLVIFRGDLWTLVVMNTATAALFGVVACYSLGFFLRIDPEKFGGRLKIDLAFLRKSLRYALKGHIQWVSTLLLLRIDLIMVAHWRGAAEAGVYAVATQVTLLLLMIPNVISWLLLPRVTANQQTAIEFTCRTSRYALAIMVIACITVIPASFILPVVYGPGFTAIPMIVLMLLPGTFFLALQMIIVQYFVGTGLPLMISLLWVATLVVNIFLNFLVVPVYGAYGAAVTSSLCYTLIFFVIFLLFRRKTGSTFRETLILKRNDVGDLRAMLTFSGKKALQ